MDARCFVTSHIRLYTDANFLYLYLIVRPDTCYFLVTNYDTRLTSFFLSLFLTFVFELFFFFFLKNLRNKKFSLAKYRSVRNNFIRRISLRTDISRKRDKSIYVERNKRGTFELNSRKGKGFARASSRDPRRDETHLSLERWLGRRKAT